MILPIQKYYWIRLCKVHLLFFVSVPKTQFVNDFTSSRIAVSEYVVYTERKRGSFISMTLYFFSSSFSDTIGTRLLRRMGWKPGQGIGPKMERRKKKRGKKQSKGKPCLCNHYFVMHSFTMDLLQMDCLRSFFLWSWWSSPPPGCTHINDYIQMTR